jgi:hypothetical protein
MNCSGNERSSLSVDRIRPQPPPLSPHDPQGCPGRGRTAGVLAAARHAFAAVERFDLLEYAAEASDLATRLTTTRLEMGPDGLVRLPDAPGLGVRPNLDCVREYLQPVKIEVGGETLYQTPSVDD